MSQKANSERRRMGVYETPSATAAYMAGKLISLLGTNARILDPAAGDGVFVRELLCQGVRPESIHAWDIDPDVFPALRKLTPHAAIRDALKPSDTIVEGIIANPPYNSHECDYIHRNHAWLTEEFGEIGLYNLYALFAVSAIRRLREGGVAVLILLDSFLTNTYHRRFREFILSHCKIHEILLAPRRLFHAGKADVRTAILTLERCSDPDARENHPMRLVDRVPDEAAYANPPRVQILPQSRYLKSDGSRFHIGIPDRIIDLIANPPARISDIMAGGAGISTGNDARYLRRAEEVADDPEWVPFYKNSGGRAYLAKTNLRIHRNWRQGPHESHTYMARNTDYYFREGISCSSMGVRFSACYLPPGCLFGINANLFPREGRSRDDLFYMLGLLNSTLAQYMLRAVLNRTNMVTPGYVKRLPYIEPNPALREAIVSRVAQILSELERDPSFRYGPLQSEMDEALFDLYGIESSERSLIRKFCADILERL